MINLKEFKHAVLQQAMHGKLTQQLPSDGNAKDLLIKIANSKRNLVQSGKLKGYSKPLPPVTDKEIPFKIPDNWVFDRIGNIASVNTGFSFKRKLYTSQGIRIIRISDFDNNGFLNKQPKYVKNDPKYNRFILKSGDSLMAMTGGSVGKLTPVLNLHKKLYLNQRVADFRTIYISKKFLNDYLRSNYVISKISNNKNSTNDNISMKFLKNLIIPIPPLSEQQRIVSKVHKCFLLADTIRKERNLHQKFDHNMKQSLLLEAMKGRLTQQLPSDGNADDLLQSIQKKKQQLIQAGKIRKHKKLPLISKDEIPFKIPKNWEWTRFLSLYDIVGGSQPPKYTFITHKKEGYIRLYQTRDYNFNPNPVYIPIDKAKKVTQKGDILLARYNGSLGDVFIANKGAYNVALAKVTPLIHKHELNKKYIWYYLHSFEFYQGFVRSHLLNRSLQNGFNKKDLMRLIIPIPPLSEQHRIVSKLHDLFNTINA